MRTFGNIYNKKGSGKKGERSLDVEKSKICVEKTGERKNSTEE